MKQFPLLAVLAFPLLYSTVALAQPPVPAPVGPIRDQNPQGRPEILPPRPIKDIVENLNNPSGREAKQDLSSPEATVRSFVTALNKGDIKGAIPCVLGTEKAPEGGELARVLKDEVGTYSFLISDLHAYIYPKDREKATVTLLLTNLINPFDANAPLEISVERLHLTQGPDGWRIIPQPLPKPTPGALQEDGLALAATLLVGPENVLDEAAKQNARNNCQSNLKQLALGVMQFVQDNDLVLAFKAADYKDSIFPYVKSEQIFHCPEDITGKTSYSFNANLENLKLNDLKNPDRVVMFYEGQDGKLDFRHNDMTNVAFADGHVKLIRREEAKTLNWKP